jgi:hypothetical protein
MSTQPAGSRDDKLVAGTVEDALDRADIANYRTATGGNCRAIYCDPGILVTNGDADLPNTYGVMVATDAADPIVLLQVVEVTVGETGHPDDTPASTAAALVVGAVLAGHAMIARIGRESATL